MKIIEQICPNCGTQKKDPNQEFCEICGAKFSSDIIMPTDKKFNNLTTNVNILTQLQSGELFDLNRKYYIIKKKYKDSRDGAIFDENGQIIGKLSKIKIYKGKRDRVELRGLNGTIAATIHSKIISAYYAQELKDPQGNIIAVIKKKMSSVFSPIFYIEDPSGYRWYEVQGKLRSWSYKVKDLSTGEKVAEIEKAAKVRDLILPRTFDFKNTYVLKILDNITDRRILVGLTLSIIITLRDFKWDAILGWL